MKDEKAWGTLRADKGVDKDIGKVAEVNENEAVDERSQSDEKWDIGSWENRKWDRKRFEKKKKSKKAWKEKVLLSALKFCNLMNNTNFRYALLKSTYK